MSDVPAAPNWINQVFTPLNQFMETTVQCLNQNLTIGDNVQGAMFNTTFTTGTTYTSANLFPTVTFTYTGGGQPSCLLIGAISRADGVLITTSPVITKWTVNINKSPASVVLQYVSGLANSMKYNITLLAL